MPEPTTELRLRELAARAEACVPLPDLAPLEQRGHVRRRRRRSALVALAATAAVAVGWGGTALLAPQPSPAPGPAEPHPRTSAEPWPGNRFPLAPGTYEKLLAPTAPTPVLARFTVGGGTWAADLGATLRDGDRDVASLGLLDVTGVATRPCVLGQTGMGAPLPGPARLVRELTALPGLVVTLPPRQERQFGVTTTHVQVRWLRSARCPDPDGAGPRRPIAYQVFQTATAGPVPARSPGSVTDVWVADVDGTVAVVTATVAAGEPAAVAPLAGVVASVELLPAR